MGAHVILNLLNELVKKISREALPSTNARFYLSYETKSHFISKFCTKTSCFRL